MKTLRALSVVLLLACLMAGIYAQDNAGQKPPSQPGIDQQGMEQKRPMGRINPQMRERMKARAQEMKAKQQKMMEEMKKMDEVLQQKVDAMNAATGEQKVNAMADVINELVKERKTMHEHMATMHKDMCDHMMMMGHMNGMRGGMMHDMGTTGTMGMMNGPMGDSGEKGRAMESEAKITRAEAERTALKKVNNGTIEEGELEREGGHLIWSFDITTPETKNITEVQIDAKTGKVVSQKTETPAQEKKETAGEEKGSSGEENESK